MDKIDLTKKECNLITEVLIEKKTSIYEDLGTLAPISEVEDVKLIDSICHKIGMYLKERRKSP
jgi:hypothetical protein